MSHQCDTNRFVPKSYIALYATLWLLYPLIRNVHSTNWGSQCLQAHNAARASERIPPLVWDMKLAADAQSWANNLASKGQFKHSGMPHGENLYMQSGMPSNDCAHAVKTFMDEKPLYHDDVIPQGNFEGYGHYTQVMWGTTTKVGCAFAKGKDGSIVTVCEYDPPGNINGNRLSSVNAKVRQSAPPPRIQQTAAQQRAAVPKGQVLQASYQQQQQYQRLYQDRVRILQLQQQQQEANRRAQQLWYDSASRRFYRAASQQ